DRFPLSLGGFRKPFTGIFRPRADGLKTQMRLPVRSCFGMAAKLFERVGQVVPRVGIERLRFQGSQVGVDGVVALVHFAEGVAEVVPRFREVVIQLDCLTKALDGLTALAQSVEHVAEIEAELGVGTAEIEGLSIGAGGFLESARFLGVAAGFPPVIGRADLAAAIDDSGRPVLAEVELKLSAWLGKAFVEADEELAVALDDAELSQRLLQSGQPAVELLEALANLRRLDAGCGQIAKRFDARHLLEVEEIDAVRRLGGLDESRVEPGAHPIARHPQQPTELRHGIEAMPFSRARIQAEPRKEILLGENDGAARGLETAGLAKLVGQPATLGERQTLLADDEKSGLPMHGLCEFAAKRCDESRGLRAGHRR